MTRFCRVCAIRLLALLGLATLATSSRAQPSVEKNVRAVKPGERSDAVNKVIERETAATFPVWKQKAQLEIEILQAQIDAKKAEIRRRETEMRIAELAPSLAILDKLEKPIAASFPNETPLEDVLKYFKSVTAGPNDSGLPIYVDPVGLQKAEKTMTSPITIDLDGIPLKVVLRLVLKQLGLAYKVEDGFMTITAEN